jgi:hypothetical protein
MYRTKLIVIIAISVFSYFQPDLQFTDRESAGNRRSQFTLWVENHFASEDSGFLKCN